MMTAHGPRPSRPRGHAAPRRRRAGAAPWRRCAPAGLLGLLIACAGLSPAAVAQGFAARTLEALAASELAFPRADSNVPFAPLAQLSARLYDESEVLTPEGAAVNTFQQEDISAAALLPFVPGRRDLLVAGAYAASRWFAGDEPGTDTFRLNTVGLPLAWLRQLRPQWQAAALVAPMWHFSDADGAQDSTQLLGGAFLRYQPNERLWWAFGVFGDRNDLDSYLMPYVGASFIINRRWTLSAIMPWPAILYAPNEDWFFSLGASPSGASWNQRVDRSDVAVSIDTWDFGLSAERRLRGRLWLGARAGIGGLRGLRFDTGDNRLRGAEFELTSGAFFSLSLKLRP